MMRVNQYQNTNLTASAACRLLASVLQIAYAPRNLRLSFFAVVALIAYISAFGGRAQDDANEIAQKGLVTESSERELYVKQVQREIGDALKDLRAQNLSPEASILWIESFLNLNKEAIDSISKPAWLDKSVFRPSREEPSQQEGSTDVRSRMAKALGDIEKQDLSPEDRIQKVESLMESNKAALDSIKPNWVAFSSADRGAVESTTGKADSLSEIIQRAQSPEELIESIENFRLRYSKSENSIQ